MPLIHIETPLLIEIEVQQEECGFTNGNISMSWKSCSLNLISLGDDPGDDGICKRSLYSEPSLDPAIKMAESLEHCSTSRAWQRLAVWKLAKRDNCGVSMIQPCLLLTCKSCRDSWYSCEHDAEEWNCFGRCLDYDSAACIRAVDQDLPVNPHSIHNKPKHYGYSILPLILLSRLEEKERLPPIQPVNPGNADSGAVSSSSYFKVHTIWG